MALDPRLLSILACPACKGELSYDSGRSVLSCAKCAKEYPVQDGIPILLVEEGKPASG